MAYVQGFPPISQPDARILILGSMPSRESLARHQYYAHPRNAFWPIITTLLEIDTDVYKQRCAQVVRHGLAIWDVLQACFRTGSLDAAIEQQSLVVNDFNTFFLDHPHIRRVFFNGAKAEAVYRKHALPHLQGSAVTLQLQRLPSTSPAHAGMSVEQKAAAWRVLLDDIVE
jgi:TDG/mug DNA glycosylase family protein